MSDDASALRATAQVGGPAPADIMPDGSAAAVAPRRRGQPMPAPAPFVPKPAWLAALYILASTLIAMTQGLGLNLVTANLYQIQGPLGASLNETVWLSAAYLAPNVSLTLLLTKMRAQFGLRIFATYAIVAFVAVASLHLVVDDIQSAIVVRFFAGVAASPMSSLAFLYMLESFPPERKMTIGVSLAMTNLSIAAPLARVVSPTLLDLGGWNGLFLLETALALVSFAFIRLLPLNSPPKTPVIEPMDVVNYLFIAVGLGSLAVVATVGPFYWWFEAPWIGGLLALGLASLTVAVVVELNRSNPLIDIRWITSKEILHFAGTLLLFRLLLSEQASGATGFFQVLGLKNEQMTVLYLVMIGAAIAAGLLCTVIVRPGRAPYIHIAALSCLIVGSYLDSRATVLTGPEQMYLSQGLISAAGVLFLPPALAVGFGSAMKRGMNYILSFLIVFLTTQSLGGAIGSALFRTFVTIREKFHSSQLAENIVLSDPIVAARITQTGAAYARVLPDAALRQAEGLATLGTQATRQANILAYNDAFLAVSILASVGLAVLLVHLAVIHLKRWRAGPADAQTA
ncbi:Major Facilitator Superfamily protein [Aureimonas phyllosphaerae]|uniref:MFS family permease n=2 Tax=Aureimonas phyllosphaerae TaxID=1166078 RepID=A0A7W6FWE4_9HYPH|nr:MFS transporter [Aureimonas phyllosphaerae]MBB3937815.1 MFS family permease [Aureimonas phyllosphaerae]MBB3961854.1 MFS family permease [Aureimonas phyllosphaerae]SFF50965.1 Major Facilitator Superfamily protein [Aureimonas phyllosphaerae]